MRFKGLFNDLLLIAMNFFVQRHIHCLYTKMLSSLLGEYSSAHFNMSSKNSACKEIKSIKRKKSICVKEIKSKEKKKHLRQIFT